jgi:hypothetical protein
MKEGKEGREERRAQIAIATYALSATEVAKLSYPRLLPMKYFLEIT